MGKERKGRVWFNTPLSSLPPHFWLIICCKHWCGVMSPANLDSNLCFIQSSISHDVLYVFNHIHSLQGSGTSYHNLLKPTHTSRSKSNVTFIYMEISPSSFYKHPHSHIKSYAFIYLPNDNLMNK